MGNKEQFVLTMPVDFAVILKHIKKRFQQQCSANQSSILDIKELVGSLFEDFADLCPEVKADVKDYEIETTGLIYVMVWLESYSLVVCSQTQMDAKKIIEKAILMSNDKIRTIKASIDHENIPCPVTFTAATRIYDAYHERLIDGENLLRITERSGKEGFIRFLDKLECTTRTFRYLDWNYFNNNSSYA